jgi:hypothetical protein
MFKFLNPKYRHILSRHNLPYANTVIAGKPKNSVTSVVIPSTGADYIEEACLCAEFADKFATGLQEIVIVTDQEASQFRPLPEKVRIVTLSPETKTGDYRYKQIYLSRLIKLMAPLQAKTDGILMIDSDLNLLKMPEIQLRENHLYSSFRQGKMIAKFSEVAPDVVPAYYKNSIRAKLVDHVNSAFLAAPRQTWERICPIWISLFKDTWDIMPDVQPPTDQPALAAILDILDIVTVNLGDWMNWPVSKKIGGTPSVIPKEVIGAHGGFPLTEWQKYLASPDNALLFKGQDYTRKVRYLTDAEKQTADPAV